MEPILTLGAHTIRDLLLLATLFNFVLRGLYYTPKVDDFSCAALYWSKAKGLSRSEQIRRNDDHAALTPLSGHGRYCTPVCCRLARPDNKNSHEIVPPEELKSTVAKYIIRIPKCRPTVSSLRSWG